MNKVLIYYLGFFCFVIIFVISYAAYKIPDRQQMNSCFKTSMFQVFVCPGSEEYVPLSQISNNVIISIIISEDASFYSHKGFDWVSIKESFDKNLEKKKIIRGGSTISQQLAKNLYFSAEKSILRKVSEMIMTAKIERELSKKEILEKYLNIIEFGDNIFGIKSASVFYFKKNPNELTLVESAFLAMLLPNPKKNSASFRKQMLSEFAHFRIKKILNDLYTNDLITVDELNAAENELKYFLNGYNEVDKNNESNQNNLETELNF